VLVTDEEETDQEEKLKTKERKRRKSQKNEGIIPRKYKESEYQEKNQKIRQNQKPSLHGKIQNATT
jgi:hypothetical protein